MYFKQLKTIILWENFVLFDSIGRYEQKNHLTKKVY